jgi:hypothetical protein
VSKSKQDKAKRDKRSAAMSEPAPDPQAPAWTRPDPDECEDWPLAVLTPDGADPSRDRILVRTYTHVVTDQLVEFAVIQETFHHGKWRKVTVVDSCHDRDIHLHRYSRKTGRRTGKPEVLMPLASFAEVQYGYELAYERVAEQWADNRGRWHDA